MPLDVWGHTRVTMTETSSFLKLFLKTKVYPGPAGLGKLIKLCRNGASSLQLLIFNEECLVSASHQLALTTSLPFVHTAHVELIHASTT